MALGEEQRWIAGRVIDARKPAVLAVNKIDTVPKPLLLPVMDAWRQVGEWRAIVPISALSGDGVEALTGEVARLLPEGPPLFPADVLTDQAERALVAELVRESVLHHTHQEVPYSVAVVVEQFDESERGETQGKKKGLVRLEATVFVERDSQKAIVIGKGGSMLKRIGSRSRRRIEALLGCRVWLGLHVKVEPDWTKRPETLSRMGYGPRG